METIINTVYPMNEVNNALLKEGYLYKVAGDWYLTSITDPWSGMPEVEGNTHFFTDEEEAKEYAIAQEWPFNSEVRGTVEKVEYMETLAEAKERIAKAEQEAKEKKEAKLKAKADALGMTEEEYKEKVKLDRKIARYKREVREMEAKVAEMTAEIERKKKFLENVEKGAWQSSFSMLYYNYSKERGKQKMKYRVYTEDNYSARLGYYLPTYFKTKKEAQAYANTLTKPATIERKLVNTWVKC